MYRLAFCALLIFLGLLPHSAHAAIWPHLVYGVGFEQFEAEDSSGMKYRDYSLLAHFWPLEVPNLSDGREFSWFNLTLVFRPARYIEISSARDRVLGFKGWVHSNRQASSRIAIQAEIEQNDFLYGYAFYEHEGNTYTTHQFAAQPRQFGQVTFDGPLSVSVRRYPRGAVGFGWGPYWRPWPSMRVMLLGRLIEDERTIKITEINSDRPLDAQTTQAIKDTIALAEESSYFSALLRLDWLF